MSVSRWEITVVRKYNNLRSKFNMEFCDTLADAEEKKAALIRKYIDQEGFDEVSHEDRVTILEFRPSNNYFSMQAWDTETFTVRIEIRACGVTTI